MYFISIAVCHVFCVRRIKLLALQLTNQQPYKPWKLMKYELLALQSSLQCSRLISFAAGSLPPRGEGNKTAALEATLQFLTSAT